MIILLSPSKTLDFESPLPIKTHTLPDMLGESQALIKILRGYSAKKLGTLMDISDKLAALNVQRYKDFRAPFTPDNSRPALLAFKGDVYASMQVAHYGKDDFAFAQKHLRILSGLYGLLRPLDLMQPYRLEMGTTLKNPRGKDLYAFWGDRITQAINDAGRGPVVNLASEEYFKAVRPGLLKAPLLNIVFKEKQKTGAPKIIGLFAKRARGAMADFIIRERLADSKSLKDFSVGGYAFQPKLSDDSHYFFVR